MGGAPLRFKMVGQRISGPEGKPRRKLFELYYKGLSNYQYHVEVHLRYHILSLYEEYGTIILVIMSTPILSLCSWEACHSRSVQKQDE